MPVEKYGFTSKCTGQFSKKIGCMIFCDYIVIMHFLSGIE